MAVPRSTQAHEPVEAALVARRRGALPNGIWAIILLICTEGAFFGVLIGSYWYLRFRTRVWPPPGVPDPHVALPLVLTGVLILTVIPMVLASGLAHRARRLPAIGLIVFATLVQGGYLAVQIVSYVGDLDKTPMTGSAYTSVYYTLLGADHAHVFIGLLLNLWVLAKLATGLTNYRLTSVRVITWYWAFVAAVTLAVTVTEVTA
jgi:heme/copper-type cytochrome/quinol oxidase subunit 3